MKKTIYAFFILISSTAMAQLSGSLNVPANYTSVASVIAAINQQGVSGPLTVNIAAGYTETAIQGGFSLTASGTATSPIIFRKNGSGANPLILAYSGGSGTPGSMNQDGVWRLIGCDYITIEAIDLVDLNGSNPATMEFGYGLFKASASDGCQNNTIKNCVITLNRINNAGGSGPASDGSRGIDVVNALSGVHNNVVTVSSFPGSNSNNKFYANIIQNCNIAVSIVGFADTAPFSLADRGNDIGGNSISTGNKLLDFGGGSSGNAAAAVKTLAQYDLNVGFNEINNNTGLAANHPTILRGIHLGAASGANASVKNNTLTLHGGGVSSQMSVIENASGSSASLNTITINNNLIINCTNANSVSGPFYGIWNTASPETLSISSNSFVNNSTSAASGSTYLIYNNGQVASLISLNNNQLAFTYNGPTSYSGSMYSVYNTTGTNATTLSINNNSFSDYNYSGYSGTGNLYFIYNTHDSFVTSINNNEWNNLFLNQSGSHYFINNNSATQSLLSVCNNSINGGCTRTASAGATYLYYSTGSSPASCVQTFSGNIFSNITATVSGTGNFYGIYTADGSASPYPRKEIFSNSISNITINSSGIFYGYYLDNLGDASGGSGSSVYNNTLSLVTRVGTIYGMYVTSSVSPSYVPGVYNNVVHDLKSSGGSSGIYGAYLAGGGLGLNFYKNKISEIGGTGISGQAYGIYVTSAVSTTLSNNFVGNIHAPNSSATNAINGIYINGGTLLTVLYNSVFLNALSTGGNFNSNALYASSTTSLNLKNNIFMNISSGGTGIAAAFRRSSTSLTNYLSSSNNNIFYAGLPGASNVILQNGTTAYQTLAAFQTAMSPRESVSATQNIQFLSNSGSSPNFLRPVPSLPLLTESGAANVAGVTQDYDSQVRQGNAGYLGSGAAPDIGADEYDQNLNPCTASGAGTIFPPVISLCTGQPATLISNGYASGTGLTLQWKVSPVPGGAYINVTGGIGATHPEFISSSLSPGTYYFILESTCASASLSSISAEATVVVHPAPSASAQVTSSLVCAGQGINLIGLTTGNSYLWIGPNGYYALAQSPTIANVNATSSGIYYFSAFANGCSSAQTSVEVNVSEVTLTLTASTTSLCSGHSATLNLSTSAITYTWSSGSISNSIIVSPTTSTVYSVAVTNTANCLVSKNIIVSVVNPTISADHAIVCGSSATVNLSVNAFTPSLINWYSSPGSTLSLGTGVNYSASISTSTIFYAEASHSISGCQSLRIPVSVTLAPYPLIAVFANPTVICPGKSATLTANGANTYSWISLGSGSLHVVSPTSPHVYTVTGKSTLSCSSTTTIMINTYTVPILSTIQTATSVCPSSVVGFTASGANSYYWNTGANGPVNTVTPAVNSTYTVYGTNTESCTASKTLAVITRSVPVITITQSTANLCPGELITFTATGALSYTWLPGGYVSNTFSANPIVTSVYNAIGKSINTCTNVGISSVVVDPCTRMEENEDVPGISLIFPNPSSGLINFKGVAGKAYTLHVFSPAGLILVESGIKEEMCTIDLSHLSKGIYFIRLVSGNEHFSQKILLQE